MKDQVITTKIYRSPLGELILGSNSSKLCLCDWRFRKMRSSIDRRISKGINAEFKLGSSPVIEQAEEELLEYFEGKRSEFSVPIIMVGSDFQKSIWSVLLSTPYGSTSTYLELSKAIGNTKAIRAVASANGANALSILVPCHRIIGNDGSLVGYAGGVSVKRKLLDLEGAQNQLRLTF